MATAREIITGALRHLMVVDSHQSPNSNDLDAGLQALNDMMFGWAALGVDVNHYALELSSPFPLDDKHVRGAKALLAVDLAPTFGLQGVTPHVQQMAEDGWQGISAEYLSPEDVAIDDALLSIPSNRIFGT